MSEVKKDVVVIGAGPGGYVAAIRLGQLGKKVLLVDKEKVGGVCLNWGCIPSKALINFSSLYDKVKKSESIGLNVNGLSVDLNKFQSWKTEVVNRLTNGVATLCKGVQAEIVYGKASYKTPNEIEIVSEGKITTVTCEYSVIATGASPIMLPELSLEDPKIMTSKQVLDLTEVPETFLVIGGGIIGLELGMALQKLGSKLIVVELFDQLLPGIDPELVRYVERSLKKRETEIFLKSKVTQCKKKNGKFEVTLETPEGSKQIIASHILVAIGVKPNSDGFGLDKIGIKTTPKGFIQVDHQGRTNLPNVFAVGDVKGPPYLAHKAFKEGEVAAEVIAGMARSLDYYAMPAAIFTEPEIATVGLSEKEAKEKGKEVIVGRYPLAASGRALTMGSAEGLMKAIIDKGTREVLGIHLVAPEASELISEGALAIEMGAFAEDIASTIHPHPTLSEGLMESFKQTIGEAIHITNLPREVLQHR